ncbi:outer membrane beta-barrel protein [Hymenobacter psychrotolerans]|uniref:Outer membrane protein beta-barrel domain-containing protein n=1 Tax=Hymenobacter psychrotolerans DSM 18569 TaxID=1121959 RepID=A0A1M6R591_9BACT|nr:outer membrane beta-barrel protein [Hymenobacter psychrotolerans]SHK27497.1 Outer membrane protein beta-barrel domain-containing protein [Hymenobacter psychrotolerans DSM 18569]
MATSAPNNTPDPRPTGDLEHLFRQKFAEAEVAPRASLWEQLDHELLVQQNETYRRRLLGYRWAAAASLLLLAGGGTWLSFQPTATAPGAQTGVATTTTPAYREASSGSSVGGEVVPGSATRRAASAYSQQGALAASGNGGHQFGAARAARSVSGETAASDLGSRVQDLLSLGRRRNTAGSAEHSLGLNSGQRGVSALGSELLQDGYSLTSSSTGATATAGTSGMAVGGSSLADGLLTRTAKLPGGLAGFGRPEMLQPVAQSASLLAAAEPEEEVLAEENEPQTTKPRRWKLNAAYAASAFNPNANFAKGTATSPSVSYADLSSIKTSGDAYDAAAAEYRDNLQAGLGQRVSLTADYSLNDNWALAAGLAVAQQEASSATSWYFLDGKSTAAAFYSPPASVGNNIPPRYNMPLRNVNYRYRTASLPVSVRYTTDAKQGWSIYAKLGAAVNVLLGSRTELEGVPEATRVYSLASADSPYRKVLASLHGGAGVRFRPAAASWSLALGPDLEAGLTTLNANPTQSLLRQGRPYAIGMEASVEFGNVKAAPVARR